MFNKKLMLSFFGLLLCAGGYQLYQASLAAPAATSSAAAARPIVAAYSRTMDLSENAMVTGTAEANTYVEIRPEIDGRVTNILFTEGTMVEAGTVLVELDARAAEAKRDEVKAELLNADQQLKRARPLRATAAIPDSRIDELQAAVTMADARLRAAEVALGQHAIKAPFTGVVGLRRISIGAQVGSDDILTTMDDSRLINVLFRVPDVWLSAIQPGLNVGLLPAQNGSTRLTGVVTAIDSRVDSINRTIGIKAQVDNAAGLIKPGSLVKVDVPLASKERAVVIPEQALQTNGEQQSVFVIEDNVAKSRNITIGLRQRGLVEVVDGLSDGMAVVAVGGDRLRDGTKVSIARTLDGWNKPEVAAGAAP